MDRVLVCSGKIYFDLLEARRANKIKDIAIVRVEQLYPFPAEAMDAVLARYPNALEIVWVQEEPRNQGAWVYFCHACTCSAACTNPSNSGSWRAPTPPRRRWVIARNTSSSSRPWWTKRFRLNQHCRRRSRRLRKA